VGAKRKSPGFGAPGEGPSAIEGDQRTQGAKNSRVGSSEIEGASAVGAPPSSVAKPPVGAPGKKKSEAVPVKGPAKLKASKGGFSKPPKPPGAGKGDAKAGKAHGVGPAAVEGGRPGRGGGKEKGKPKVGVSAAAEEVEAPGVSIEEGLREQDSAQTTQGKAQLGKGGGEVDKNAAQEPQSKNAAEDLAGCLAEIDEFLKDN